MRSRLWSGRRRWRRAPKSFLSWILSGIKVIVLFIITWGREGRV